MFCETLIHIYRTDGNSASDSREATTQDLSLFPSLSFSEVEEYAKKSSGCENTAKAYKFFAEPGYLHDIKGKLTQVVYFPDTEYSLILLYAAPFSYIFSG